VSAANYAAVERLGDGFLLQIRALRPADRTELLAAFERSSEESRYRRFFAQRRKFSEQEIDYFLTVDFVSHVALAAVLEDGERQVIGGGGRYVLSEPGSAEVAFAVDDPHQRLGIGARLLRHLVVIARRRGVAGQRPDAEVVRTLRPSYDDASRGGRRARQARPVSRPRSWGTQGMMPSARSSTSLAAVDRAWRPASKWWEFDQSRSCRAITGVSICASNPWRDR
jgi:GNAT superfamily N-acetyltransferase